MSTFDYGRFVALGKRMLTKYGALTTMEVHTISATPNKPWEESGESKTTYSNLLSAKFDPVKTLDGTGKPLKADATFYLAVEGLKGVDSLPSTTIIFQNASPNERWSVVKSELIKPAETGVLWILWVNRYA